jgi:hypothetical protein
MVLKVRRVIRKGDPNVCFWRRNECVHLSIVTGSNVLMYIVVAAHVSLATSA